MRGDAAGADCCSPSGAGSAAGAGRRRPQPPADCSAAAASHSHRPLAATVQSPAPPSITHADCTDGDDELSESSTAAAAVSSREGGGCRGASAATVSPWPLQWQLTSKASHRAKHDPFVDGMRSDEIDDANGAGGPAASQSLSRRRRSSSRIRRRSSRSRSTRRRVFANPAFPADSPDSDDSSSSDESQWSASKRLMRNRSQLCELLAGGRCRSLRGLLIRTVMRPAEIKGEAQLETAVICRS